MPPEQTDVVALIRGVVDMIGPLLHDLKVSIRICAPEETVTASLPVTAVRQALVHIIMMAARRTPSGKMRLSVGHLAGGAYARIAVTAQPKEASSDDRNDADDLRMAQRLIEIAGGYLETRLDTHGPGAITADIALPVAERTPILVIDDNADTLRLLERYLANSRYRCVGLSDPQEVFPMVAQTDPAVIVLDVMLPGIDGWELLGRLREHPETKYVPVVVCTILSQEQLALTLGATDFLRKPITQDAFLATLDRQIALQLQRSRPDS
jgi:CheY-like chemotaxis protein